MKVEATFHDVAQRQLKVLVVDQSMDSLEMMTLLCEYYGHSARVATGCAEARYVAEDWLLDVILTGMRLRHCNGEELAHTLKGSKCTGAIPLVELTGRPVCVNPALPFCYDRTISRSQTARCGLDIMASLKYEKHKRRDAVIADALQSALTAMSLVNGSVVTYGSMCATLCFEREMLKLHESLILLGIDSTKSQRDH